MQDAASLEACRLFGIDMCGPHSYGQEKQDPAVVRQRFEELLRAGGRPWDAHGKYWCLLPAGELREIEECWIYCFANRLYGDGPSRGPIDDLPMLDRLEELGAPIKDLVCYILQGEAESLDYWDTEPSSSRGTAELLALAGPDMRNEWRIHLEWWESNRKHPNICAGLRTALAQIETWTELRRAWVAAVVGRRAR